MNSTNQWTEVISSKHNFFTLNLKEVWRYRDLVYMLVRRDFVTTFKQTVLGPVWFFVQPILTTLMFLLVFRGIANLPVDGPPIAFYLAGTTLWSYFSTSMTSTSNVFRGNANIFGKVYFPRLVMPISIVISNLMRFGVQFLLFIVVILYYLIFEKNVYPNWWILATPFLIVLMAGLSLGLGMIFSSMTTKYKDLSMLLGFGIQLFMYATPVILPVSGMPEWALPYINANPLTGIFECFKYAFIGTGSFEPSMLIYSTISTFVILLIGTLIFNKVEKSFMDTV
ncbi:MAG: ABC transporter permease [Flavobacteriaceae bacterium]|jgi:lipopolysaccharide transport system permease protein|nr:ABC transporter permease [Flavobacteriaceae bacterium]